MNKLEMAISSGDANRYQINDILIIGGDSEYIVTDVKTNSITIRPYTFIDRAIGWFKSIFNIL